MHEVVWGLSVKGNERVYKAANRSLEQDYVWVRVDLDVCEWRSKIQEREALLPDTGECSWERMALATGEGEDGASHDQASVGPLCLGLCAFLIGKHACRWFV